MEQLHLFLTGERGIGKSTLIGKLLAGWTGSLGGFYTKKLKDGASLIPGRDSVHLFRAGEEMIPTEENLLFCCGGPKVGGTEKFNRLGCAALACTEGVTLILMDELGPHEGEAKAFRNRVLEILDGDIPVLGVLQQSESEFLEEIAGHPKVKLVTVTRENRDRLAEELSLSSGMD